MQCHEDAIELEMLNCNEMLLLRKLVHPNSMIGISNVLDARIDLRRRKNGRRLYQTDNPMKARTISVFADTTWNTVEDLKNPLFVIDQVA